MNNTHSSDNLAIVTTVTVIGTFMLFFVCFALRMCLLTPHQDKPPTYQDISAPPVYEETPPSYELSSCTQILEIQMQESHPQVPPELRD